MRCGFNGGSDTGWKDAQRAAIDNTSLSRRPLHQLEALWEANCAVICSDCLRARPLKDRRKSNNENSKITNNIKEQPMRNANKTSIIITRLSEILWLVKSFILPSITTVKLIDCYSRRPVFYTAVLVLHLSYGSTVSFFSLNKTKFQLKSIFHVHLLKQQGIIYIQQIILAK